jgi:hypothetical protein
MASDRLDPIRIGILLSECTAAQTGDIYDIAHSMSREQWQGLLASERARSAAPGGPLNSLYESEDLDHNDLRALRDGKHAVFTDALVSVWDAGKWSTLLQRVAFVNQDMADEMGEEISTPDSSSVSIARGIAMALPDIPIVTFDDPLREGLARVLASAGEKLYNYVANQQVMPDTLFEMMNAGYAMAKLKKRRVLMAKAAQFESATFGPDGPPRLLEAGAPTMDEVRSYIWGGQEEGAPNPFEGLLRAADGPRMSPFLDHADKHPEQGGLFSSIGKAFKKAVSTVAPLAKIAAPLAFGPLGGAAVNFGLKALSPGTRRSAVRGQTGQTVTDLVSDLRALIARHGI